MCIRDSNKVIIESGKKITKRTLDQNDKVRDLYISNEEILGKFISEDIVNFSTGEIFAEAGDEITEELLASFEVEKIDEIPVLLIDNVNFSPFVRNTLAVDKSFDKTSALFEIYKILRPGEPPTVESASNLFTSLFFDSDRYDLSDVGRVKINMRLNLDTPDDHGTLTKLSLIHI